MKQKRGGKEKNSRSNDLNNINRKLNKVIAIEKNLLKEEENIEKEEKRVEKEEKVIENIESKNALEEKREDKEIKRIESELKDRDKKEGLELEKLEKIEEEIKQEVGDHPLAHITGKDFIKGMVGAFVGLAVHYTFTYGVEISENLSFARATLLFPITFIVGLAFIYSTGFRKIKDPYLLIFMPVRLIVLYISAILMSIMILYLFYPAFGHEFLESYKMVAGVMLAAVVGACTADLIGKE